MFDDNPQQGQGQAPANLPIGEPEDIFASVDAAPPSAPPRQTPSAEPPAAPPVQSPEAPPSALSAGVLQPKKEVPRAEPHTVVAPPQSEELGSETPDISLTPPVPPRPTTQAPPVSPPPPIGTSAQEYAIKEPAASRRFMAFLIIGVVVLIVGGGSWWVLSRFVSGGDTTSDSDLLPATEVPTFTNDPEPVEIPEETDTLDLGIPSDAPAFDDQILFGEPTDTDADGLDDVREGDIGTDVANWDTDGDSLSDGDEVIIWKTDPLNPDTDGDSYLDGQEVLAGYNPDGPGRIFEPPTEDL